MSLSCYLRSSLRNWKCFKMLMRMFKYFKRIVGWLVYSANSTSISAISWCVQANKKKLLFCYLEMCLIKYQLQTLFHVWHWTTYNKTDINISCRHYSMFNIGQPIIRRIWDSNDCKSKRGCHVCDRMVVRFKTTYAISTYHH